MEHISKIINNLDLDKSQTEIIRPLGIDIDEKILKHEFVKIANSVVSFFLITKELKPIYSDLWNYFHGKKGNLDLNKGIAIAGSFGTGKTSAFRIYHEYLRTVFPFNENMFRISSIEDVIKEVSEKNWTDKVLTYNVDINVKSIEVRKPVHVLVNEFGYQYNIKNYGSDVNELIEAWLMKRYDIFQQYRKLTHVTTNFGTDELKEIFHPKIIDRFKEMFNFIELKGESFRK